MTERVVVNGIFDTLDMSCGKYICKEGDIFVELKSAVLDIGPATCTRLLEISHTGCVLQTFIKSIRTEYVISTCIKIIRIIRPVIILSLIAPTFMEPMFGPPEVLGIPLGVIILLLGAIMMLIGFLAIRRIVDIEV